MSLHPLNPQHTPHVRSGFAMLRNVALGVVLAVTASASPAAHPPASAAKGFSDVVLARTALAALDADPELKGVNLVVSVVDGVAVVGGPVPSQAVARRAEKLVREVDGMKEVRNTCFVSTGPDPLLKAVADKSGSLLPPRPVMNELPGVLTNQLSPPVSPFPPNSNLAMGGPNSTVVAHKPSLSGAGSPNILGAPVGAGNGTPAVPEPATAPGTLTGANAGGILAAAADLRKTEARFANLSVEIRDGIVVIGGQAAQASDAWDFARKLRAVPGVSRVAVGSINGK